MSQSDREEQSLQKDTLGRALDEALETAKGAYVEAFGEAALRQHHYPFKEVFMARRALHLSCLFGEAGTGAGADGWIAKIVGTDAYYRLDRRFLARTSHVLHKEEKAFDFTGIRPGDYLQGHLDSRRHRQDSDLYLRVVSCTDGGLVAETLTEAEVAKLYHGDLR